MNVTMPRAVAALAAAVVAVLALGGVFNVWSIGAPAATSASADQAASGQADPDAGNLLLRAAPPALALPKARTSDGDDNVAQEVVRTRPADVGPPAGSGSGRRVVFDMSEQRVWLVRPDQKVQRTYLVSGSKHPNLKPGRYRVYSKSRHAVSYTLDETMRLMVRFAHGKNAAIGFHDIPIDSEGRKVQTRAQLGTPLSAGCVRQAHEDARALWKFAHVGTRVAVIA